MDEVCNATALEAVVMAQSPCFVSLGGGAFHGCLQAHVHCPQPYMVGKPGQSRVCHLRLRLQLSRLLLPHRSRA